MRWHAQSPRRSRGQESLHHSLSPPGDTGWPQARGDTAPHRIHRGHGAATPLRRRTRMHGHPWCWSQRRACTCPPWVEARTTIAWPESRRGLPEAQRTSWSRLKFQAGLAGDRGSARCGDLLFRRTYAMHPWRAHRFAAAGCGLRPAVASGWALYLESGRRIDVGPRSSTPGSSKVPR